MSVINHIDDEAQARLRRAREHKQRFEEVKARALAGGEEFCSSCLKDMGFNATEHVDHPYRSGGGAFYSEGGQTCAECAKSLPAFFP